MAALKVLSIDDDQLVQTIVHKALGAEYNILTANTAIEGIQKAESESPDIILLDIEMPGIDGYETCQRLKNDPATQDIPIMFLSGRSDLQSRLSGYNLGATDFLIKPFEAPELRAKLNALGKFKVLQTKLTEEAQAATKTAYTAMRNSSLFGQSINCIEQCIKAANFNDLTSILFNTLSNMGLSASIMINNQNIQDFYSSDRQLTTPLEKEVMKRIYYDNKRYLDFGSRTQINYVHIALLVKNMPIKDKETYGLIKDLLPNMLAVANEKIINLTGEKVIANQTRSLNSSFDAVQDTLTNLATELEDNQKHVTKIFQNLMEQLETRMPALGLDDDQEVYLIETFDKALTASQLLIDKNQETRTAFDMVSRLLQHLGEKQKELLKYFDE